MFEKAAQLVESNALTIEETEQILTAVGLSDWKKGHARLLALSTDESARSALSECLPMLLSSISATAVPDASLLNFERYARSVPDLAVLFRFLADYPRSMEILVKLFVGSQFLTEILLRNPTYLERLTEHKRVAEIKNRRQFVEESRAATVGPDELKLQFDALRKYQRWELLRIGACDAFGLLDLKSVTVQLSLLADGIVQTCLALLQEDLNVSTESFTILAMGKLGGEELNYSSDIDLVFISDGNPTEYWQLGQQLINTLSSATSEGFLYRTDMRLRPWGRSGALVSSTDSYVDYLKNHGMLWELQALMKARPIAGNLELGHQFLRRIEPLIYAVPVDEVRDNVREMKNRIETELARKGRQWGEVKSGAGSIRDIEFVTQFLQMSQGGEHPEIRSFNTVDGLLRLADFGFIRADEYRHLTSGYVFLRTIEHSLQLMHHKQTHSLPESQRELMYLARRLDFSSAEHFVTHYDQHCSAIRAIYDRYIGEQTDSSDLESVVASKTEVSHVEHMEPSYLKIFGESEIERHGELLRGLDDQNLVELAVKQVDNVHWQVTVVGFGFPGDLSIICGLLYVFGFNIKTGNVFTDDQVARHRSTKRPAPGKRPSTSAKRKFVIVFTVRSQLEDVLSKMWNRYRSDLRKLMQIGFSGKLGEAQGRLAKRVAGALRETPEVTSTLYPVEIQVDNGSSKTCTVLSIRGEDTPGFLYELTNALALAQIDLIRVMVGSIGNQVFDTLYVTDNKGEKILDPNRQSELRATIVLIKHFTHLLPRSSNPEAALVHFREFLEQLFKQPNWVAELASLERSNVLDALARLLGVSNFLWQDFLRLQHDNLFPIVRDIEILDEPKLKATLASELDDALGKVTTAEEKKSRLNAFKDREMFRTDMRHILGHISEFGQFSAELTDVAEVVVNGALQICNQELQARFGTPMRGDTDNSEPSALSICALGKCGGRELGFASDIELVFVYQGNGKTQGPEVISSSEYFQKLVEEFNHAIRAKRKGIFEIDLRLRPYGSAGRLAVALDAFERYFAPDGAAWPYERQALVKLRPIAGDPKFGAEISKKRDEWIYTSEPFDVAAMRAMRERQVRQLVKAGTTNAKLSPGGLVDCEYLVQGLQISYGRRFPAVRAFNTDQAMTALKEARVLSDEDHRQIRSAYIFQRRLIDALRMVRGDARDLTVPPSESEEFEYLARRLRYGGNLAQLRRDLELHTQVVQDLGRLLDLT